MMRTWFVDLHVHVGFTASGRPVKISAARDLTFARIVHEAACRKGLDAVGIIDAHVPEVQEEIRALLAAGEMVERPDGGLTYGETTIFLGAELEVKPRGRGAFHVLCYLPTLAAMADFTAWLRHHVKNVSLSSQRVAVGAHVLQDEVAVRGGVLIPAHVFTPHKGLYGSAAARMAEVLDAARVPAVELGLSADSAMADSLSELADKTFLSNSDAHSLANIGREYQAVYMAAPTFEELLRALRREGGRGVAANYGLNPRLGKYHRTACASCGALVDPASSPDVCPACGHNRFVRGVADRILAIADQPEGTHPPHRPRYVYQVPLAFIPGLGPKKRERLLEAFGTEMAVLHHAPPEELAAVVGRELADLIVKARKGRLALHEGGGGRYGRVARSAASTTPAS